jgi:hypothetical protein
MVCYDLSSVLFVLFTALARSYCCVSSVVRLFHNHALNRSNHTILYIHLLVPVTLGPSCASPCICRALRPFPTAVHAPMKLRLSAFTPSIGTRRIQ